MNKHTLCVHIIGMEYILRFVVLSMHFIWVCACMCVWFPFHFFYDSLWDLVTRALDFCFLFPVLPVRCVYRLSNCDLSKPWQANDRKCMMHGGLLFMFVFFFFFLLQCACCCCCCCWQTRKNLHNAKKQRFFEGTSYSSVCSLTPRKSERMASNFGFRLVF